MFYPSSIRLPIFTNFEIVDHCSDNPDFKNQDKAGIQGNKITCGYRNTWSMPVDALSPQHDHITGQEIRENYQSSGDVIHRHISSIWHVSWHILIQKIFI